MLPASAQLRDFAARYSAAWCSQNPEAVASFFSTNGSLKINDAAPSVGRHALSEAARSFMTAFPDLKISMNDLIPLAHASNTTGPWKALTPAQAAQAKKSASPATKNGNSAR